MLWVLADPHAGTDPEVDRSLLELLAEAERRKVDLLILGDLFRVWVGLPKYWTQAQRSILEALERLRATGARVRLVTGNRDYLAERQVGRVFDEVFVRALVDIGGIPSLVAHGDLVDPEDRAYRAWHALSRGPWAYALLRGLPGPAGRWLTDRLERRLRNTNRAYKAGPLPLPALQRLSRRARAEGAQQVLLGHFHADRVLEVDGGVPVILAPSWLDQRRILELDPSGVLRSVEAPSTLTD